MACPFCTAIKPSLAQWRERSSIVALAEVESTDTHKKSHLRLHRVMKDSQADGAAGELDAVLDVAVKPGSLVLLFGSGMADAPRDISWHAVAVNELGYAYFARSPALGVPTVERLRYFAPFLEHADPTLAEDAYLEFAQAPFDDVARAAEILPSEHLRRWLADPKVRPERKGFYALALGLVSGQAERRDNAKFLAERIFAPDDDFRAGFDGMLGGYLLLTAESGLKEIESRILSAPAARDGDLRHALSALRFYHEHGKQIPAQRLCLSTRLLLDRPEFAADAITDLARWQDWQSLDRIVALYDLAASAPATRRAIVGYLMTCPKGEAAQALERLRRGDPAGVAAAERVLSATGGLPEPSGQGAR